MAKCSPRPEKNMVQSPSPEELTSGYSPPSKFVQKHLFRHTGTGKQYYPDLWLFQAGSNLETKFSPRHDFLCHRFQKARV